MPWRLEIAVRWHCLDASTKFLIETTAFIVTIPIVVAGSHWLLGNSLANALWAVLGIFAPVGFVFGYWMMKRK